VKEVLVSVLLFGATLSGAAAFIYARPRRLIAAWIGVGFFQSLVLLVIGFEFLAVLNALFIVATATVLRVYSTLLGGAAIYEAEKKQSNSSRMAGLGAGFTVGAILFFSDAGRRGVSEAPTELDAAGFVQELLKNFPELPWVLGVAIFFSIIAWASLGRPGWKSTRELEK